MSHRSNEDSFLSQRFHSLGLQASSSEEDDSDQDSDEPHSRGRGMRHNDNTSTRKKVPRPKFASAYPRHQPEALQLLTQITGNSVTDLKGALYKTYFVPRGNRDYKQITKYVRNGQDHRFGIEVVHIIRIVRNNDYEFPSRSPSGHRRRSKRPSLNPSLLGANASNGLKPTPQFGLASACGVPPPPPPSTSPNNPFRMVLWHGTLKQHVSSILMKGFVIPPAKNQMFGAGIYFADRACKSARYCVSPMANPPPGSEGYMFLCDVKLGLMYKAKNAHNGFQKSPDKFDTVKCCGKRTPDFSENAMMKGAILPSGQTIDATRFSDYILNYNEYIAYETDRVKAKYLVIVKFHKTPKRNS